VESVEELVIGVRAHPSIDQRWCLGGSRSRVVLC
jgi:hypothetical protein